MARKNRVTSWKGWRRKSDNRKKIFPPVCLQCKVTSGIYDVCDKGVVIPLRRKGSVRMLSVERNVWLSF